MRLTPDWKAILRHAWSVRLMLLAAALSGAEAALPFVGGWFPLHPGILAGLSAITVAGAFAARFVAQRHITPQPEEYDCNEHA